MTETNESIDEWIPDDFLLELGRLSVYWGRLETAIEALLMILASKDGDIKPILILIAHSSFPQKIDCIGALCELHEQDGKSMPSPDALCATLRTAQKGRNTLLHNTYHRDSDSGAIKMATFSARGSIKAGFRTMTVTEIIGVSNTIRDAQRKTESFIEQVHSAFS